jgi:glycosyltransferase involved in cell wall biosynthesis
MDHSLRWLSQFKSQYPLILIAYKMTLRRSHILIYDDPEQNHNVFKILKRSKDKVHLLNPCIVNENIFHPMDKYECAKKVDFKTTNNIVSMSRIVSLRTLDANRTYDYEKNVFLMIEIFRWMIKKDPNIHLHIAGDGPGMEELRSTIEQYSLQNKVTLHGWIQATNDENDNRSCFINAADLFIFPGRLIEFNIGQALFEALMCAKPVVAFKRYDWVATEHSGGFLVDKDPEVAAEQILSRLNSDYLKERSIEARMVPIKHGVSMELWSNKLLKIIKEILRG